MTPQQPAAELQPLPAVADPVAVTRELLALTILAGRVKDRADDLRGLVAEWEPATKNPVTLPNPDNPRRPYKVGEVRCDNGNTRAMVDDPAAFEAWTRKHSPHNVVIEPEHQDAPSSPGPVVLDALRAAFESATLRAAPGPFQEEPGEALWRHLCAAGWQLAPIEVIAERVYVQPGYVNEVLRLSKEAGEPAAPGGAAPAGVAVVAGDPKAVVTPVKDRALQDGFLQLVRAESAQVFAELVGD